MTKFQDGDKNEKYVKFEGTLSYILFPRPPRVLGEDGDTYGVTKWKVNKVLEGNFDDPFATEQMVVGVFGDEPIEIGSVHTLYCKQIIHIKYGVQYQLVTMEEKEIDWNSLENQRAFLERIVSPNVVNNLYKEFDNPLKVIAEHDIDSLIKVKGIGEKKAEELIRKFEAKKGIAQLAIDLADYNLTYDFLLKLKERYGYSSTVVKKITQTPYDLIFEMDGVGFKTADSLALKGGISAKSPERIKGFVYYYLADKAQEGNSYVYASELTQEIFNEFEGKDNILETYYNEMGEPESNNINEGLNLLINAGILVKEEDGDKQKRRIYLKKYYNLEKEISNHLKRLLLSPNGFKYEDWEEKIKEKEKEQGWSFTEEQKEGIKLGLDNQVCFITGLGGTGKSSLVSGILSVLGDYNYAQCSLSGKAAARLKEVTGKDGSTIHRLLGYNPVCGFRYNEKMPLPYDIIIVDEVSLIGGEIFLPLLRAMKNGTKLYVLGDMGQLESIGCMNLAADLYYSKIIPTKELTQIHRQAQKSGIITSSHQVREEEQLFNNNFEGELILGELKDMYFDIVPKEDIVEEVIKYFEQYYYGLAGQDIMNIQLISPVKERGSSCVAVLNKRIQNIVNPQLVIKKPELFISQGGEDKGFILRQGDKVLCTQNLYEIDTTKAGKTDIFNGWTGIITDVKDNKATIYFPLAEEEVVMKERELKNSIILGYAITCHKMQGASAKIIIGAIDFSTPPKMLTKELLYTMITRAEKIAVIVGQNKAIARAINTSGISDKKTFLQELLVMKDEDKNLCDIYNNHLIEAMQKAQEEN